MSLLSNIALTLSVGALGFAGGQFGLTVTAPPAEPFTPPVLAGEAEAHASDAPVVAAAWPALFGYVEVAVEEAEPEAVQEAPSDYILTGLIADGAQDSWALISEDGFERIKRVGDEMIGGETVEEITAEGVWIISDGTRQLIPVRAADMAEMYQVVPPAFDETEPAEVTEVTVGMERLDLAHISDVFEDAGNLIVTELADGSTGLDVVWIQTGALYDEIGLKTGDMILRINGNSVETADLIAQAGDGALGGVVSLEIIRDGARKVIKVNLAQL